MCDDDNIGGHKFSHVKIQGSFWGILRLTVTLGTTKTNLYVYYGFQTI